MSKIIGTSETWVIPEDSGLDSITVFWQNFEKGRGRVTIECYGSAWTAYWGGMGDRTIQQFFAECGSDYLFGKLGFTQFLNVTKGHETYLKRLIKAVQNEIKTVSE